jgi:predicted NAD/FAD-binding protein
VERPEGVVDNGQHILIGAYRETLQLLQTLGVKEDSAFLRVPLTLTSPQGRGLQFDPRLSALAPAAAIFRCSHWPLRARLGFLFECGRWMIQGFRCAERTTVRDLCRDLHPVILRELIEPLCVAAMNTPAQVASGAIFLRVLKDSVFSSPGASDLLIPRVPLSALVPDPAIEWLRQHGAHLHFGTRVHTLEPEPEGGPRASRWRVNGQPFDTVILACPALEASRLVHQVVPSWAEQAQSLNFEAIATAVMDCDGLRLRNPMVMLQQGPAQFAFDHGALGAQPGRLVLVASAASEFDALSTQDLGHLMVKQVCQELLPPQAPRPLLRSVLRDRRATWLASAGLARPQSGIAPGLIAAGDFVAGPYPATLEGAVRSGLEAAQTVLESHNH